MATIGQLLVSVGVNASGVAAGLRDAEKSIESFGTRMFFLGSRITAGVTVPLVGAMGAVAKFGLEFDKAMTESTAIMGDMSDDMRKEMEDVALAISKSTKFSAKEAAEAYYDLASAGLDAGQSMKALGTVATFAQAGVVDLSKAGEYLATSVSSIGLKMLGVKDQSEGMAKVADVLVKANNMAIGTTEDYAKALSNTRGALRIYNVSLEQGVAALMAFANGGIVGQKAGQQLYMVLRDLQRVAQRNAADWERLGLSVYDVNRNLLPLGTIIESIEKKMQGMNTEQKFALMTMLGFPDRSRAATQALLGMGGAINSYTEALRGAKGASQDVADKQMLALSNVLKQLRSQFEAVAIQLFREFVPALQAYLIPALKGALAAFQGFANFLGTLSTETKGVILGLMGMLAALGPVIAIFGSWTLAVRGLMGIFSGWAGMLGGATTALGGVAGGSMAAAGGLTLMGRAAAFALGPWGLLIGAAVSLGLALYSLKTAQSDFQASFDQNEGAFKKHTQDLAHAVDTYFQYIFTQKLTAEESKKLEDATRTLAAEAGLSVEAFKKEEEATKNLSIALQQQVRDRKALIAEMRNQRLGEIAEAQAAMQAIEKRMSDVHGGRAKKWISAGTGAAPVAMPLNMSDHVSEMKELEQNLLEASQRYENLRKGVMHAGDIRLPGDPIKPVQEPTGKPGAGTQEKIELFEKFKKEIGQVTEALRINAAAGNTMGGPMLEMYKEYHTVVEKLTRQSKLWGYATADVFTMFSTDFVAIEKAEELDKLLKKINDDMGGVVDGVPKWLADHFKAANEEAEKLSQTTAEFAHKFNVQFMTDSEARISQIEVERKKAIEAAQSKFSENAAEAEKARKAIDKYYDFEVAKAKETQETIVQRMKDMGVQTAAAMQISADKMLRNFKQMQTSGEYTAMQLFTQWKKWFDFMNDQNPFLALQKDLGELAGSLSTLSQTMGDSDTGIGGWVKSLGAAVASMGTMATASKVVMENIGKLKIGFAELGKEGSKSGEVIAASLIGIASGIMTGISGMMSATGGASLGKNMLGGAMTGAMTGASLATMGATMAGATAKGMAVAGIWGAVAGAIVGIMIAVFRGRDTRSLMKRVGHEWGQDISQGLAEGIKRVMKEDDLSRTAATLLNMDKIIEEADGLNNLNFNRFIGKLRDVFVELETGGLTAAQATQVLEDNFTSFANVVVASGKVATKEFVELLKLTREAGLEVAAITEFISQQTERFGSAMAIVAQSAGEKYKGLADDIMGAKDALKELDAQRVEAMGGKREEDLGVEDRQKLADIDKHRAELMLKLTELQNKQTDGAAAMRVEMERIGLITLAGFNAAMDQGQGVVMAYGNIAPAIAALKQAYKDLGIEVDNAALKQLFLIDQLATEQPGLVNGVGMLGEAMLALSNIGGLNIETFGLMQEQGMAMYERLQAEAQKLGIDQSFAIKAMIPFLKGVISASEEYGFEIDENTKKLIAQAREMGLLKDKEMTTNDILMDGFKAIINALGGEIPAAWKDMANKAKDELDGVSDHARDIFNDFPQPPPITIPVEFEYPDGRTPTPWPGNPYPDGTPDVPEMGEGGIVRRRTLAYIGERGPEAVIPLPSSMDFGERETVVTNVYLDGRKVSLSNVRHAPGVLRARGITTR